MKKEPSGNVYQTCEEHTSKPQAKYLALPDEAFVGNYVYRRFAIKGEERFEHCWILVDKIEGEGRFSGTLENDPVKDIGAVCGERVEVLKGEIEKALDGRSGRPF